MTSHLPTSPVRYHRDGCIGFISVNHPPVNALSQVVRAELMSAFDVARQDTDAAVIVLRCEGRTFMAGADITEFGGELPEPHLPDVVNRIEAFDRPVIAVLHGTALGGGLEVAMGCHYRIADARARMGLPEAKLGLIPGAGGTQRLPRLVGAAMALEMIANARPIDAAHALAAGLVDRVANGALDAAAVAFAEELLARGASPRRTGTLSVNLKEFPPDYFSCRRAEIEAQAHPQPSALAIVEAVEAACTLPLQEGLRRENRLFIDCYRTPQAAALWHVFFAERAAAIVPGTEVRAAMVSIVKTAVVGAGTLGCEIAMCLADAGLPVALLDASQLALERGRASIESVYALAVQSRRIDARAAEQRLALVRMVDDYAALGDADLVVEAALESMTVKHDVFGALTKACKPEAILATSSSTLDVDAIAATTARPEQVLGLHFLRPANANRLIEVVRGARTSDAVLQAALKLAPKLAKLGIVSGACSGLIANRTLDAYLRQAGAMLLEGATPAMVDEVATKFGFATGPFAMPSSPGIDVGWRALAVPDAVAQRELFEDEILDRLLLTIVNEGARVLEEGVVLRSSDLDLVWINGFGFPEWRGGPMYYADRLGIGAVVDRLRRYAGRFGSGWAPAPLLVELAKTGRTLSSVTATRR